MPTITTITNAIRAARTARGRLASGRSAQRMQIRAENGQALFEVPYAPQNVEHSGLAPEYATAERPGRAPLLERSNEPLPKMSFTLFLGSTNLQINIDKQLQVFKNMALYRTRFTVAGYSGMEAGLWRITSLDITVVSRNVYNNVSRANVDIEFTRASDVVVSVGPVTGGVKPPKTPVKPAPRKPAPSKPRYYVVKKGDTLWDLAVKYYKDGTKWRRIADANGVRNPRLLQIGKKLRIP